MDLKLIGQDEWNDAYSRGGNITFYPNEEVVRFINRYIRKRRGISEFENIMNLNNVEWHDFRSLDLGCGIGRHVRILEEFELNPYGIDLSETAIEYGHQWFNSLQKQNVAEHLVVGSVAQLPYADSFFDICISVGVLDSMPKEIANKGMTEVNRVLKEHGLFFLSLIMDVDKGDEEIVVDYGYEKNTVQSYFTKQGIMEFVNDNFQIIDLKIVSTEDMFFGDGTIGILNENLNIKENDDKRVTTGKRAYVVLRKRSAYNI